MVVLIVRCAWHRRHFGYTSYTGLTRDFRWRVAFSDGICRPCADVMRATAWGTAPKSVSIRRELARAAMALTGVAAWLLVMLLFAGCGASPALGVGECFSLAFEQRRPRERWESPPSIMRVAEVGRDNYRVEFWSEGRREFSGLSNPSIGKDWNLERVACPR